MNIKMKRKYFSGKATIGSFEAGGKTYYTMEDKDRLLETAGCEAKVPKETAIPRGKYKVIIDFSNRYQKLMPHILDVKCFEGIRIHVGNYVGDTEGCILLGTGYSLDPEYMVTNSKKAFADFFPWLEETLKKEEVWIEVC